MMDTQSVDPSSETGDDWRTQLPPHSRPGIVNYLMKCMNGLFPFSGQEGQEELKKIAMQFEEKLCIVATSSFDYLETVVLMKIIMESTLQNTFPNSLPPNPSSNHNRPPDSGASYNIQPQVHNQGQPRPMPMSPNQSQVRESQACEQILSENIPSNVGFTGVQSSSSLTSAQPSVQQAQNFLPYLYQQLSDQNFIQPAIHQKKALMMQQLMAQLPNATNMQQNQLSGQQNQHTYLSSLQQTSVGPLQANITNFLSQSWENLLQQDIPLQSYPNMLQHENLKQLQEQMVHSQHLNQDEKLQQLTKQEMLQQQQFNQQAKQQLPALHNQHEMQQQFMEQQMLQQQQAHMVHSQQLNQHEIQQQQGLPAQMHQRDDVDEPDVFQQHISRGQHTFYTREQMISGAYFPTFSPQSPQLLQAASPHLSEHSSSEDYLQYLLSPPTKDETPLQSGTAHCPFIVSSPSSGHSSPGVDQQNLLPSLTEGETLLQSGTANSPFIVSSPSTPLPPSPMPGDSEKPVNEFFPFCNAKPD